ncbi:MAG TPA: hypothetical protein VMR08_01375 [Patescibacteria group bacterium]|jgi:hypothetical protein|nr:hypothetical protein [Patescibacteria group bacterium]
MILYNSPVSARDLMADSTPEDVQESMAAWIAWRDEAVKTVKFEFGLPLQAVSQVTKDGLKDSNSLVSGYSMIESDSKQTVLDLVKSHPHLKRQGASIEVLEMLPMPGM